MIFPRCQNILIYFADGVFLEIGDDVVVDHIGFGFDCAGTKLLAFNVTLISRIHIKERSPGVYEWIKSILLNFSAKISFVLS